MSRRIFTENPKQHIQAISTLKIPEKSSLATAGNSVANKGDLIFDEETGKFYGHNGVEWTQLTGGDSVMKSPWVAAWRQVFVRPLANNTEFDNQDNLSKDFTSSVGSFGIDTIFLTGGTNKTYRQTALLSASGPKIKIRLTNRSVSSDTDFERLHVDEVRVAKPDSAQTIIPGTSVPVTFNGSTAVDIIAGADVISDEIMFNAVNGEEITISIYISGNPGTIAGHPQTRSLLYINNDGGNDTDSITFDVLQNQPNTLPFNTTILASGVDVYDPESAGTIVCLGDSTTDGTGASSPQTEYPAQLAALVKPLGYSVVNSGLDGNKLTAGGYIDRGNIFASADKKTIVAFGASLLERLERDVFSIPNVTHVFLSMGHNDIMWNQYSAECVIDGLEQTVRLIQEYDASIKIYLYTLAPIGPLGTFFIDGNPLYTPAINTSRQVVNTFILNAVELLGIEAVLDANELLKDPENPIQLLPEYKSFDQLHLNDLGYQILANALFELII